MEEMPSYQDMKWNVFGDTPKYLLNVDLNPALTSSNSSTSGQLLTSMESSLGPSVSDRLSRTRSTTPSSL